MAAIAGNSIVADYDTCISLSESKTASANATLADECEALLAAWQTQATPAPAVQQLSTGTRALLTSGVDDSHTKALLHLNGADGSTAFTDETGKTWSASGNSNISTSQSKFGGASLALDGSGDYIYSGDSTDWDLGQVFTIDFWVRFNQVPSATILLGTNAMDSRYNTPGWLVSYQQAVGGLRFSGCQGPANWPLNLYTTWTPSTGTWYHVAVTRDSTNTIRTFINGQQTGSVVNSYPLTSGTQSMYVGGMTGLSPSSLNGNIDEVRISKGIARWTSNFVPPTHEYGLDADFTATPVSGSAPLTVQFTDASANSPTSWSWNFGDGGTSTAQNPSHVYSSAGTYTVSLTVTKSTASDTETKTGYVTVTNPINCDVTGPYVDFTIYNVNHGSECTSGDWEPAVCYDNALIRYAIAGSSDSFFDTLSQWRWKRNDNCPDPGHTYAIQQPYGKDIHIAGVKNSDSGWYHAVATELLTGEDPSYWDSWKFFNYDNLNIQKGDYQIPAGTDVCRTKVWIRHITSVFGCGNYDGPIEQTFYIDSNLNIQSSQDPNCPESSTLQRVSESLSRKDIPAEVLSDIRSVSQESKFGISKWDYDPDNKEITLYVYDIPDDKILNDFQGQHETRKLKMVHDEEFETTRMMVQKQIIELKKNPDYEIARISMVTDAFGNPPAKYAELWVHELTPENKKLEGTVIQGWTILVYPMSA